MKLNSQIPVLYSANHEHRHPNHCYRNNHARTTARRYQDRHPARLETVSRGLQRRSECREFSAVARGVAGERGLLVRETEAE